MERIRYASDDRSVDDDVDVDDLVAHASRYKQTELEAAIDGVAHVEQMEPLQRH